MRPTLRLALALCAPLCAGVAGAGLPAGPAPGAESASEDLHALLAELEHPDALLREHAQRRLLGLKLDLLEPLLDVLFYRVVPNAEQPVLSLPAEDLLLRRLASWPSDRVALSCLRRARQGTLADRLRALELFGSFARAGDWDSLLELCASLSAEELAHPLASEHIVHAIERLVERDGSSLRPIARSIDGAQPWLLCNLAQALGRLGREDCLPLFSALLDRDAELDAHVLKALGNWKSWSTGFGACVELLETYLRAPEPDVRRAAACSLGRLRAGRAIPSLILALDDHHSSVRRSALWSLRYGTGLEFLTSYEEWAGWYEREETWRTERAPALLLLAAGGPVSEALAAVLEVGLHPWFDDLAPELVEALAHDDAQVVQAACAALARIGDELAFDALLELCEDERPEVRAAARTAFELLAGVPFDRVQRTNG